MEFSCCKKAVAEKSRKATLLPLAPLFLDALFSRQSLLDLLAKMLFFINLPSAFPATVLGSLNIDASHCRAIASSRHL